jgi:DNA (cytosine-5)-methyltransferase 1
MSKPKLLDLFCGAGGAGMGYHRTGFDVVGVDIKPQPHYPFEFHQGNALEYLRKHGHEFDAIHASPPCQAFSAMRKGRWQDREHPDLIEPIRALLKASGKPWVIENVRGAPVDAAFVLCGTMFGLEAPCGAQLRRHRLFESPHVSFVLIPPCQHNQYSAIGVYGGGQHPQRRYGGASTRDGIMQFGTEARRIAMGIDWMTGNELSQAIPPAYTEFIGNRLLEAIK